MTRIRILLIDNLYLLTDGLLVDILKDVGNELWIHATERTLGTTLVQDLIVSEGTPAPL